MICVFIIKFPKKRSDSIELYTLCDPIASMIFASGSGKEAAGKGLLPTVVERYLKRRLYFKRLLKEIPKDSAEYVCCERS